MSNRVKAITRLFVAVITVVNMVLTAKGYNPIPLDETALGETLSYLAAGFMTFWTWWKDAPMTAKANKYHDEMVLEKRTEKGAAGENFFDAVKEADQDAGSNL